MKKALKIGIMGMIGFMLFVYGGLNGYCMAWSRLYDRGNYIGADGLSYIAILASSLLPTSAATPAATASAPTSAGSIWF